MQAMIPEVQEFSPGLKLDFGCGQSPREGFEGVDLLSEQAVHRVNLWKFPFPWPDDSVTEIHCSHFAEHLPCREIEERDLDDGPEPPWFRLNPRRKFIGQDFFLAFFDECWRILRPQGKMTVIVPAGKSDRGFQDPTHRRFFVPATFMYLSAEWRKLQKLDHYRVTCDFAVEGTPSIPEELSLRHQMVQAAHIRDHWNAVHDWHIILTAIK